MLTDGKNTVKVQYKGRKNNEFTNSNEKCILKDPSNLLLVHNKIHDMTKKSIKMIHKQIQPSIKA